MYACNYFLCTFMHVIASDHHQAQGFSLSYQNFEIEHLTKNRNFGLKNLAKNRNFGLKNLAKNRNFGLKNLAKKQI